MQQADRSTRGSWRRTLAAGAAGGLVGGVALGVWTLGYQRAIPDGGLDFLRIGGLGDLVTSVLLFALAHALLGATVGALLAPAALLARRQPPESLAAAVAFGVSVGLYVAAQVLVAWNFDLPANVALNDPVRSQALRQSLYFGLGFGVLALVLGVPLFSRLLRSVAARRVLLAVLVVAAGVSAVALLRWSASGARYEELGQASPAPEGGTNRVILIGLDGASWQLLDRLSREGHLPNIDALRAAGTAANLVTHGKRLSPSVWTGVATGWSHREHGILGFTVADPVTGTSRTVGSGDRLKPSIWQILSSFGRTSAVVNWYASYPAEKVKGVIVSRLVDLDEHAVHPADLTPTVAAIVESAGVTREEGEDAIGWVDVVFELGESLLADRQPDLMMLFVPWTDWHQHVCWAGVEPGEFDDSWGLTREKERDAFDHLVRLWSHVDTRVGDLVRAAGPETAVVIVSDHGFKPRSRMMAYLRPNALLEAMGLLTWTAGEDEVIDYGKTKAFSVGLDTYDQEVGISVNEAGRQPRGIVPPDSTPAVARQVADELSRLRVEETGEPLFFDVRVTSDGDPTGPVGFDVVAGQAAAVRTGGPDRTILIQGRPHRLDDFLTLRPGNSGNHSPRGVFIGAGPGLRKVALLPLVADSPYTDLATYVTGYVRRLEPLYRVLRALGWLDPYTSIDVTPTVLYLLGLPLAADMEGRLMEKVVEPSVLAERAAWVVESYGDLGTPQSPPLEGEDSEQTLERLRALGYIQ